MAWRPDHCARRLVAGLAPGLAQRLALVLLLASTGCAGTGASVQMAVTTTADAVGRARCGAPITQRVNASVLWRAGDDRYGAGRAHVGGETPVGAPCGGDVRFAYVRGDTEFGLFAGPVEIRHATVEGAAVGTPPSGVAALPLAVGVVFRGTLPPDGSPQHALALSAGEAVTLLATGTPVPGMELWLGAQRLDPYPAAGGGQFVVAPATGTYTVRVTGRAGAAYVLLAAPGGTAGRTDGGAPPSVP